MEQSLVDYYRTMCLMRAFENGVLEGVRSGEIHGEMHLAHGSEAIAAGIAGVLRDSDAVVSTHRPHLHALAKDVPLEPLLAEIYERETGLCRGKGGHMHLFAPNQAFMTTGICGATMPIALGHAYASWAKGRDDVAVAVTGDGAVNTGAFHESLNLAAVWKLPYVALVENNRYAISVPVEDVIPTQTIANRACAYDALGVRVDGMDPEAVTEVFSQAVEHARSGEGPALVEATCYRYRPHWEGDLDLYRPEEEKEEWRRRDPLHLVRQKLLANQQVAENDLDEIKEAAEARISAALKEARAGGFPDPSDARAGVFVEPGR